MKNDDNLPDISEKFNLAIKEFFFCFNNCLSELKETIHNDFNNSSDIRELTENLLTIINNDKPNINKGKLMHNDILKIYSKTENSFNENVYKSSFDKIENYALVLKNDYKSFIKTSKDDKDPTSNDDLMKEILSRKDKEIKTFRDNETSLKKEVEKLKLLLVKEISEKNKICSNSKELANSVTDLLKEINDYKNKIDSLTSCNIELLKEKEILQKELNDKHLLMKKTKEEIEENNASDEDKKNYEDYSKKLTQKEEEIEGLLAKLKEKDEIIAKLTNDTNELKEIKTIASEREQEILKLKEINQELEKGSKQQEEKITNLETSQKELEDFLNSKDLASSIQIKSLQSSLETTTKELEENKSLVEEYKVKVEKLNKEISSLKDDVDSLKEKLSEKSDEDDNELKTKNAFLEEQITFWKSKYEATEKDLKMKRQSFDSLEFKFKNIEKNYNEISILKTDLEKELSTKEKEIEILKNENKEFERLHSAQAEVSSALPERDEIFKLLNPKKSEPDNGIFKEYLGKTIEIISEDNQESVEINSLTDIPNVLQKLISNNSSLSKEILSLKKSLNHLLESKNSENQIEDKNISIQFLGNNAMINSALVIQEGTRNENQLIEKIKQLEGNYGSAKDLINSLKKNNEETAKMLSESLVKNKNLQEQIASNSGNENLEIQGKIIEIIQKFSPNIIPIDFTSGKKNLKEDYLLIISKFEESLAKKETKAKKYKETIIKLQKLINDKKLEIQNLVLIQNNLIEKQEKREVDFEQYKEKMSSLLTNPSSQTENMIPLEKYKQIISAFTQEEEKYIRDLERLKKENEKMKGIIVNTSNNLNLNDSLNISANSIKATNENILNKLNSPDSERVNDKMDSKRYEEKLEETEQLFQDQLNLIKLDLKQTKNEYENLKITFVQVKSHLEKIARSFKLNSSNKQTFLTMMKLLGYNDNEIKEVLKK